MMIASYLSKRGDRVTLWQIRFHMLSYLKQYREATIKEHGKTGPLFYALITTLVLMVVFLIIVLILLLT